MRNVRSSSFLRRSHAVTSLLCLLALQEGQAGTTFSNVYRPPRETGWTQSRWSATPVAWQ